jgi:hypothetical protein
MAMNFVQETIDREVLKTHSRGQLIDLLLRSASSDKGHCAEWEASQRSLSEVTQANVRLDAALQKTRESSDTLWMAHNEVMARLACVVMDHGADIELRKIVIAAIQERPACPRNVD